MPTACTWSERGKHRRPAFKLLAADPRVFGRPTVQASPGDDGWEAEMPGNAGARPTLRGDLVCDSSGQLWTDFCRGRSRLPPRVRAKWCSCSVWGMTGTQSLCLAQEVVLFEGAGRAACGFRVLGGRRSHLAGLFVQVGECGVVPRHIIAH